MIDNSRMLSLWERTENRFLDLLSSQSASRKTPEKFVQKTTDWFHSCSISGAEFRSLDPFNTISRREPITIEKTQHWIFETVKTDLNWETFVALLPFGRVVGSNATVLTPDHILLGDVSREPGKTPDKHSILSSKNLPRLEKRRGRAAVLCVPAGEKYFHWMMDVLPRLELIERAGHILDSIDWFVCNPLLYDYQFESLDLLGIPKEKFISLDSRSHFEFTELLVPSLAGTSGNMLRSNIDFIRSLWTPSTHKADRKLFISRSDAKYRHLINEQEGYQKLRQHGYEYTTLTGTSVMDQSKLFSAASEIVACHGAGLTNLAFCQSGTRVLELFAPQYVNPCYYSLSHWRDIQYAYLIGEGDRGAPGTDLHKIEADITADANQILSLMGYT